MLAGSRNACCGCVVRVMDRLVRCSRRCVLSLVKRWLFISWGVINLARHQHDRGPYLRGVHLQQGKNEIRNNGHGGSLCVPHDWFKVGQKEWEREGENFGQVWIHRSNGLVTSDWGHCNSASTAVYIDGCMFCICTRKLMHSTLDAQSDILQA